MGFSFFRFSSVLCFLFSLPMPACSQIFAQWKCWEEKEKFMETKNKKNAQNKYNKKEGCETIIGKKIRKMLLEWRGAGNRQKKKNRHWERNKENDKFSFNGKVFVFVLCKYYVERIKPNFICCCCAKYFNGFFSFVNAIERLCFCFPVTVC